LQEGSDVAEVEGALEVSAQVLGEGSPNLEQEASDQWVLWLAKSISHLLSKPNL
jgi:hypothetical protein